jgi:outer membrane protein assembly factor BamB
MTLTKPTTTLPALLGVLAFSIGSTARAEDWPQWRGIHRDGKSPETGLLKSWPEGGPKLLWTARNLGGGYTTPSVVDGHIYGMGYRGDEEVIWALDAATGKEIWSSATGPANRDVGYAEGPRCTPTVDGDRLYTLGAGGNLAAVERKTGKVRWKKEFVADFGGKMMSGWGFSESPLVDGDRLVCTPGGPQGTMLALNKLTGEKLWQSAEITDTAAYSSIMVATLAGTRQYVQLTDSHVFGVKPETGAVLWKAVRKGRTAVIPTPVIDKDMVYVTSGYGVGCSAFKISRAGDKFTAEEVYENKVMKNHHGGVLLVGGHLYGHSDGGGWTCQNFETGEAVWQERSKLGKGAIAYADGRLYCRFESEEGTMVLLEATPAGYREQGRFEQPERSKKNSWPHPIITGGQLYLRDQEVLLCYDVKAK